ncbi:MAG TPA: phytoene/squalene synthase family protein [Xanthobacteraceae bacterium]|jgi:phytoene synthase|nr:phytoene/squalene synthase family protein [Xanthobacteraceae bacterium]
MQEAYAHCEAVVRAADKDRFLAALFAPVELRRHLHALYAFNGEIARVREAAREVLPGEIRLQWWRDAVGGEARGEVDAHPIAAALRDTIARCGLPSAPLLGLIDAHSFDLYDEPMASLADLDAYGRDTEGALMALGTRILAGNQDSGMAAAAAAAGIACTIAHRLRSFPYDVSRRQMFVPSELLERYGVPREELESRRNSERLRAALAELRACAHAAFAQFRGSAGGIPDSCAPAFLAVAIVAPLLTRLDCAADDPFMPVELPQWRRQWAIWRAARRWPVL